MSGAFILKRGLYTTTLSLCLLAPVSISPLHAESVTEGTEISAPANPWAVHNPEENYVVDHSPINTLMDVFGGKEKGVRALDYNAMNGPGVEYLEKYIKHLEEIPVSKLNRDEQLAYWLNLHNAGVMHLLAQNPSIKKMHGIRGLPGAPGLPWEEKRFTVEGHSLSLEEIEQDILMAQWGDPLILYGLCFGAIGSPSVAGAFTGETVYEQLEAAAKEFVNDDSKIIAKKKDGLQVSSLYIWHEGLFPTDEELITHLKAYADKGLRSKLAKYDMVSKFRFDWTTASYVSRHSKDGGQHTLTPWPPRPRSTTSVPGTRRGGGS